MCGIAGFFGNFDGALLGRMSEKIMHRGPDAAGLYFSPEKKIGLAHRRLSIIDLSPQGNQPMWDATRTILVVFNGEIYNFPALKAELEAQGYAFKSRSDTEVLVNLYLRDGEAMLERLNGIFAFAMLDTRDDTLLVARDGIGVKPLYYSQMKEGVLFASELKALLEEPRLDRAIDAEAIHHYISYLWCPAPHTILKSVRKLEPGFAIKVKQGRIQRKWRFYDLPYGPKGRDNQSLSDGEAIQRVEEALSTAVRRQMISDVPVGAFLSGGLDSSAIVAMALRCSDQPEVPCFTIGFQGVIDGGQGIPKDLPYAQRVAEHLGTPLHVIYAQPEMIDQLEKAIYHLDEPQADPAPIHTFRICQLAREKGIKVLLSGTGGDDVFSGYRRHFALEQEKYWGWLPRPLRRGLRCIGRMSPASNAVTRRIARAFSHADLDGDERIAGYFHWADTAYQQSLYGPAVRDQLAEMPFSVPLMESLARLPAGTSRLDKMLYLEGKHFLADHNLNYTDKMSMAVGVEVRVPLLDPDLVATAAALPDHMKQRGRVGKWIFKKVMEGYLPKEVIYRPKAGFGGVPMRTWLRRDLRPLVEDVLCPASLNNRGLFDPVAVRSLIDMDRSRKTDAAYTIFSMICIELWCRIFLDRVPDSPLRSQLPAMLSRPHTERVGAET